MSDKKEQVRRNQLVLGVLERASKPLGPTEIGKEISEPWCVYDNGTGKSNIITPILQRLGAVKHHPGKWTKPESKRPALVPPAEWKAPGYLEKGTGILETARETGHVFPTGKE